MQLRLNFLIVLFTLASLSHSQPMLIKWADLVEHIPTAVSHQSSTVVHSSGPQRTPLLTPAVRSFVVSPTYVQSHHTPLGWSYLYNSPSTLKFYGN